MKRIYFLVPNIDVTKWIVDELLLARIAERHIHIIAKPGTSLEDLPEANLLQKSDFIPAVEQGVAIGGATGMLAGLVAIALPATAPVIAGGVLLASTLAGAGVGSWLGGVTYSRSNPRSSALFGGSVLGVLPLHRQRRQIHQYSTSRYREILEITRVELHCDRDLMIWEVRHFGQIPGEETAVAPTDTERSRPDDHTEPILAFRPQLGRNTVEQNWKHRLMECPALIQRFRPPRQVLRR